MKNLISIFIMFTFLGALAQNKQVLYGLEEVPQSLLLNPGVNVPQKSHFGIPLFSQFHINAGMTGVSVFDIFGESSVDINTRIRNKIFELEATDFFSATQQLEIINFGWRATNEIYFSGGIYEKLDFIVYFPKDLAVLAYEGNQDYIGVPFDLGQISTTGDLMTVFHFGANKQVSKKLTLGLRAKLYSSLFSFKSTNNQGTFITREGNENSENIYEHTVENLDASVQTSGIASLGDSGGASQILGRAFFGGNVGVGVDLGATYKVTEKITTSASILDLGVIFHSKDVESYRASGTYTLDGIELLFPPIGEGEPTFPYYEDLEDEIEREIPIDTLTSGYTQLRPVKFNASVSYNFGRRIGSSGVCDCLNMGDDVKRDQAVGLQYYAISRPKGLQMSGTFYYYRRLWEFLSAKATYTVDPYSKSNVGLGLVADAGKVNFYVALDNLLRYGNLAKAKNVSLQLGINIKIDNE